MSDRAKKEPTPPHLLMMPAGGGLTLDVDNPPNVLMPVIQDSALIIGDEDGEADSFLGQSPPKLTGAYFQQQQSNSDPFSHIGQSFTPLQHAGDDTGFTQPGFAPPPTSAHPSQSQPVTGDAPPKNIYRQQGPPRYAAPPNSYPASPYAPSPTPSAPPIDTYAPPTASQYPPTNSYPSSPMATPYTPIKTTQYAPSPMTTPYQPSPMAIPYQPSPMTTTPYAPPPTTTPYAPSPISTYAAGSSQEPQIAPSPFSSFSDNPLKNLTFPKPSAQTPHGIYQPVQMHWCYCLDDNGREIWRPFSLVDSLNLEEAFMSEEEEEITVRTDGGRYDVTLKSRSRHSVYWDEPVSAVRRCSWFYKRESDGKYVPYSESFSDKLEVEYKNAIANNLWHKRLEFEQGETIVMHNPNVIVHFQPSSQPDEWGTVQGDQMRPRVVKRGVDDFETISDGEPNHVDHVVFVVHGIGSACDMKLRSIVECVDDFRTISLNLVKSHFKGHVIERRVGRVEFLPVHWHSALHSDATGIDKRLELITLRSTAKLREFVNDTLLDVLFYTSPSYCQTICDTVTSEMNRLFTLFKSRHPYFNGSASVIGHSLGSSILYDILSHQHDPNAPHDPAPDSIPPHLTNGMDSPIPRAQSPMDSMTDSTDGSQTAEDEMTLETLLSKVGLSDKMNLFEQEQIDMDSIGMCSDSDLKDLGLPMGPRKKLQGLLRLEAEKQDKKKVESAERAKREAEEREREAERGRQEAERLAEMDARVQQAGARNSVSIEYLQGVAGTGQPLVNYPQLDFTPAALFALGSPVGVFLTIRGIGKLSEDYHLPTCPRVFNIYHPFDPVAYRIEPLLNASHANIKPVLIPHHKGRKRLHLELKEGLTRVGADLKQRIIATLKTTWNSFNEFARAHRGEDVDQQVTEAIQEMADTDEKAETASLSSNQDEDIPIGSLNGGRRIDYVLQEKPIESFNDYLFAVASHLCYWESEDTVLMVLKELYAMSGLYPTFTADTTPRLPTLSPVGGPSVNGPPGASTSGPTTPSGPVGSSYNPGPPIGPSTIGQSTLQNHFAAPTYGDTNTSGIPGPPPLAGFMRAK